MEQRRPRIKEIVQELKMEGHPEGGWFSEVYTAPVSFTDAGEQRALAGSIYYLLDGPAISAFHQIDCEELWYYHEGTGMRLYVLKQDGTMVQYLLGKQLSQASGPWSGSGQAKSLPQRIWNRTAIR